MKQDAALTFPAKWRSRLPPVAALLALIFITALPGFANAQAGSEGGSIGKQNKSIGGSEEIAPARSTIPTTRRAVRPAENAAPSPCRGMAGSWTWSSGGTAVISAGGTLKKGDLTASWTCKNGDVHIVWSHGYIDDLKLDPEAGKLSGKNNRGFGISGTRTN